MPLICPVRGNECVFCSKRNSRTARATTQSISITAHQHNQQPTTRKPTTTTATNNNTATTTTTTISNQQQMHSHKNSNNSSHSNSGNTQHQITTATTVPSSCFLGRIFSRIGVRVCAQKESKAAAATAATLKKITSPGIKQHGNSVAASDDSGSAIPVFWPRTATRMCVTQKPWWSINNNDSLCKLFCVVWFSLVFFHSVSFATAFFWSALQFNGVSQSVGGSNINIDNRCCSR